MKRLLEIGSQPATLEWTVADGQVRYTMQRTEEPAVAGVCQVEPIEPGVYSVIQGNASFLLRVSGQTGAWQVTAGTETFAIAVTDPRETVRRRTAADQNGPIKLTVPIPGKVVRVLASVGDRVEEGQGIVVVEAMKMQNEVKAPRGGLIESLNVAPGAAVSPGDVLAVIGAA